MHDNDDPGESLRGTNTYNDIGIRGYYISPHDFYLDGVAGMLSQSSLPMNFVWITSRSYQGRPYC